LRNHWDIHQFSRANTPIVTRVVHGQTLKTLRRAGKRTETIFNAATGQEGKTRAMAVDPPKSVALETDPDACGGGNPPRTVSNTPEPDFVLVIAGESQPFKAVCIIIDWVGVEKSINIEGHAPGSYGLHGKAADCRVDRVDQHAGTLSVEIFSSKSSLPLGANSTDAAFGCVRVRSDGPWGRAEGRRCSRVIRRF
jgi:hypothetical protein